MAIYLTREEIAAIPNLFVMFPSNKAFVEGRKDQLRNNFTLLGLTLIAAIFALGMAYRSLNTWIRTSQLSSAGIITEARVINGSAFYKLFYSDYHVTYRFQVQGTVYERNQGVNQNTYDGVKIGSSIKVAYLPNDPTVSAVWNDTAEFDSDKLGILILSPIGSILSVVGLVLYRRKWQLSKHRNFLKGVVLNSEGYYAQQSSLLGPKGLSIRLSYQFIDPNGNTIKANCSGRRNDLAKTQLLPKQGTPVVVVYMNEDLYDLI